MIRIIESNEEKLISTYDDIDNFLMDNIDKISDKKFANVLKDIIMQNSIDLKKVAASIKKYMPEIKVEK